MRFISSYKYKTTEITTDIVGGKAHNLFELNSLRLNVPPFVVIPSDSLTENAQKLNEALNDEFIASIAKNLKGASFFAVRSSATDEDGSQFSFAGQFETYLFVPQIQLAEKIKLVWLSAQSDRVKAYRQQNNLAPHQGIAVIVQTMIEADAAGVAFGINPTNGNANEKIISSVWGLGEGLVSGELNADTYIVSSNKIVSQIAKKEEKIIWNKTDLGGIEKTKLKAEESEKSSLTDAQIHDIANMLGLLDMHYGQPQDVEFALYQNTMYLLQTRPITTLNIQESTQGDKIIWDNSNIIESYPGVTSPLTFSFITKMYEAVYIQLSELLGVSQKDIEKNKQVFANMLGLLDGRVYYNLLSWYKALAMLPGYALNAEFMERMMGVKERFELKDYKPQSAFAERLRVLKMVWVMLRNFRQLNKMRTTFQAEFNLVMRHYNAIDLNDKTPEELMNLYLNFEQTLLIKWKAPLVNDFFAMIFFGVTQKLTEKYKLPPGIHNDLLCGARDIISTEPIRLSRNISAEILKHPSAKALFLNNEAAKVWNELENVSAEIKNQIKDYIAVFGERCVGELKLETKTYKQAPELFIRIIQGYVRQGIDNSETQSNIDITMREEAEKGVRTQLKHQPLKKFIFNYFLSRARVLVSARENLRFERTRGFGKVREIFNALDTKLLNAGLIENKRDIFFLTKEEIFDFIKGTAVTPNLKSLINMRKMEYANFEKNVPNERITTYGIVYHANDFYTKENNITPQGDMQGLGCCPGKVRARVQVVRNPTEVEDLNGDILVTSSTDPGWVTLFPTASGILVERGSLLSHSAIVSREMGKPCIVGITGLLARLKTGDEVEMDGKTGVVNIITPS